MVTNPPEPAAVRVLVVAPDVVGPRMAGPGLRAVALARELAGVARVILGIGVAGSGRVDFGGLPVESAEYADREELERLVDRVDVIFCQFIDTNVVRYALGAGKRVIYDFYNALPVETVGAERISGFTTQPEMDREFGELIRYFRFCCRTGSYFVTSNERQRDWWLGYAMASGALAPSTLGGRGVEDILGLVPFGMENSEPAARSHGLRGRHGITDDDTVLVWAGGIWDWFDPGTVIRAVASVRDTHPRLKLVFYGTVHPNAAIGRPAAVGRAQDLAADLGVLGESVIFLDEWVPADQRADYLLDADIAVSAHQRSLETHYAFRTRILDHFWAGLPTLTTEGDWFAEYIRDEGLGEVTPCGDVEAMARAILRLADDPEHREKIAGRVRRVREGWRWSSTAAPLVRAVQNAHALPRRPLPAEESAAAPLPAIPPRSSLGDRLRASPLAPALVAVKRALRRVRAWMR